MFKKDYTYQFFVKIGLLVFGIISLIIASYFIYQNIYYPENVNIVLVLPFVFFFTPYLIISLYEIKRVESKMEIVPRFLRDIVDNVDSGMDLISSIKITSQNEYGVLNEDIEKLSNQLSWGIDFELALLNFADNVGSRNLKRDFLLVVEARKVGGHVEKILREFSEKISVDNLRSKERKSNLSSNTFTGYVSFFIFIFIIILIYNNLFVGFGTSMDGNDDQLVQESDKQTSVYLTLIMLLSYELAILSGFLFGLMQENNVISGAPHVVALTIITFFGFFFFIAY